MKKMLAAILAAGGLFFSSTVNAEIMTYEGTDEYIMSEFETLDIAKQRAKQKAARAAQEKAGVFVESNTEVVNMVVTKDEIFTMTSGILSVVDVQYQLTPLDDGKSLVVSATVKAEIDSEDVAKWLNRGMNERSELVAQNVELQRALAAQDAQIAELKRKIVDQPQNSEEISAQFAFEDKIFLSNQKLAEASKFYYAGDLEGAISLCTQAIKLNSSNSAAYSIRGAIYYKLNDFNDAKADYDKAVELNPNDHRNFYNRGLVLVKMKDYRRAAQDFSKSFELNPNDEDSRYNYELCLRAMNY